MLFLMVLSMALQLGNKMPANIDPLEKKAISPFEKMKMTEIKRKEEMEYKIMRLFPSIYDKIFEGKTYDGRNYVPINCVPISYYDREKHDELNNEASLYYNHEFKGRTITELEDIFVKEKNDIEKNKSIFINMRFIKRKTGADYIAYQVPMEDPESKICIVAIDHQIYFHVDAQTDIIESVSTARSLLAP